MGSTILIATLPKSGTWYSKTFFWCYSQLILSSKQATGAPPDLLGMLRDGNISERLMLGPSLGIDELYVCHSLCPGYAELKDPLYAEWEGLSFPLPANAGEELMRLHGSWEHLNPALNPGARILYLYRNPLDHFVSYYDHLLNHTQSGLRYKALPDGTHVPLESLHDFVFDYGILGSFIRHYRCFREMERHYPGQVKMITYGQLTKEPYATFDSMLTFMGIPAETPLKQEALKQALSMCSKESMMAIESKLDRSLGGDQTSGARHVGDGRTGKWRERFLPQEVQRIEAALNLFDISLREFSDIVGKGGDTASLFPSTDDEKRLYQHDFLRQQLALAGTQLAILRTPPKIIPSEIIPRKRLRHYLPRFIRKGGRMLLNTLLR